MPNIERYVLIDSDNNEGDWEYESFKEAVGEAISQGDTAVVARIYEYDDSELVWTPDGSSVWPPTPTCPICEAGASDCATFGCGEDVNENPPYSWAECGGCGGYHPSGFVGDCRDDFNRWPFVPKVLDEHGKRKQAE
jgi:hypothetical protein